MHEYILFRHGQNETFRSSNKARKRLLNIVKELPSQPKAGRIYKAIEMFPVLPSVAKKRARDKRFLERALRTSKTATKTNLETNQTAHGKSASQDNTSKDNTSQDNASKANTKEKDYKEKGNEEGA